MAQLQTLSLAFGETEDKAIELSRGRIGTLVSAISTPKDGSTIGITKDADGNSLLSGYVKPAHGETMLESNKYLLEKNNLRVVGEVQRERYRLNLGGVGNVYEGNDVQVYCQNEDGVNVSMQSMVVWIYADFAMVSKSSDLYNDSDIMAQFNVVRGADDYGWINLGNGLWRATLADSMGMLKIAAPTSNYSWTLPCYLRAYPASIDENETTTDAEREARLTEPLDFVAQAIAVTDATISCSKEENIQAGDMLVFRVGELLPANNTKAAAVPTYSVLFNASEGSFDGSSYQVPDVDSFTITALVTYMGMQISVQRQFTIDKIVLTQTSNAYVFGVVRDALGLPSDTTGITNVQCANATAEQIRAILLAFSNATANFTFEEGKYFTCAEPINILSVTISKATIFNLGVKALTCTGANNFFSGNGVLTDYSFPNLKTIQTGTNNSMFNGCRNVFKIDFPELEYWEYSGNDATFGNIGANVASNDIVVNLPKLKTLQTYIGNTFVSGNIKTLDLPSLETLISSYGCAFFRNPNITTLKLPKLKTIRNNTNNSCYAFCASNITELDLPSLETMSMGNSMDFQSCGATRVTMDKLVTLNAVSHISTFNGNKAIREISCKSLETISTTANVLMFEGCSNLTSVDMPKLKYIGGSATSFTAVVNANHHSRMFQGCTSLVSINLPSLERVLGGHPIIDSNYGMFCGCTSLVDVTLGGENTKLDMGVSHMFQGCVSLSAETNEIDLSNSALTNIEATAAQPLKGALNVKKITFPQTLRSIVAQDSYGTGFLYQSAIRMLDLRRCNRTNLTSLGCLFTAYAAPNAAKSNLMFARLSQRSVPTASNSAFGYNGSSVERYPIFVPSATFATYRTSSGWSSYYDDYGYNTMLALYNQWLQNGTTKSPWALDAPTWAAGLTANSTIWLDEEGNSHAKPYWEVPMIQDGATYFGMHSGNGQWQNTTSKGQIMMYQKTQYYLRGDGTYLEFPADGGASSLNNFFFIEGTHDRFLIRSAYRDASGGYPTSPYYWSLNDAGTDLQRRTSIVPSCYWKYNESYGSIENLSPSTAKKYLVYNAAETLNSTYVFHLWSEHIGPRWSLNNAYNNMFRLSDGTLAAQSITQATIDAHKAQNNRLFPDTWMKWMCEGYMRDVDGNALSYDTINGWINEEKGTTGVQYDLEDMSGNLIYEKLG